MRIIPIHDPNVLPQSDPVSPERTFLCAIVHQAHKDLRDPRAHIRSDAQAFWQSREDLTYFDALLGLGGRLLRHLPLLLCLVLPGCGSRAPAPAADGVPRFEIQVAADPATGGSRLSVKCWGGTDAQNRALCATVKQRLEEHLSDPAPPAPHGL